MSTFWSRLTGSDPAAPHRARRPKAGLRPGLTPLEGRQLMAVTMGTTVPAGAALTPAGVSVAVAEGVPLAASTAPKGGLGPKANWVLPGVAVAPKYLGPSDGRYAPVTVSGGLNSVYIMDFDGPYKIFPKPATSAKILSQLPLPDPTVTDTPAIIVPISGTYTATVPGSTKKVTVPFTEIAYAPPTIQLVTPPNGGNAVPVFTPGAARYSVTLPGTNFPMDFTVGWSGSLETNKDGSFVMKDGQFVISPNGLYTLTVTSLPVSPFENSVIDARLNGRRGPSDAVLNVTDQYRQDEPRADAPLTLLAAPTITPFGLPTFVKSTFNEKIFLPTSVSIVRQFSYAFSTRLQVLKHPGTSGRQYVVNVSSEDADDGGSANTAAFVPVNAATTRR